MKQILVWCPTCGSIVEHQPDNPDDQSHCFCRGTGLCACPCHARERVDA